MKHKYLVVYDYGMGGIWLFIYAKSAAEIEITYPELSVVEHYPDWLKGEHLRQIERDETYDIDEAPRGLLLSLVKRSAKISISLISKKHAQAECSPYVGVMK